MIDWTKPIETVDWRKARLVETHRQELWLLVWVASENEGPGDVYMMTAKGCRCDSRSIEMGLQTSQFIRNVRVKREGWVNIYGVFKTEEEAKRASMDAYIGCQRFVRWEEWKVAK